MDYLEKWFGVTFKNSYRGNESNDNVVQIFDSYIFVRKQKKIMKVNDMIDFLVISNYMPIL